MDRSTGTAQTGAQRGRGSKTQQSLLVALALALLSGGALLLHASIVHAGGSGRPEPLVQQQPGKLLAGDVAETAGAEAHFGSSAALSADGGTLLIGAPRDNDAHGAAWVFTREAGAWVPQGAQDGKLTAGELPAASGEACTGGAASCEECAEEPSATPEEEGECAFGTSVALSADGNTALVGNPTTTNAPGAVWVFTREGSTWTRTAVLTGANAAGEGRFGKSVALSADGATALVGDPSATNGRGSAWLFKREGSSWTPVGGLSVEASAFAHFGRSVALSGDASLALIGGPGDDGYAGAAWTFTYSDSGWTQQPLKVTEEGATAGDHFGRSVALSADGSTALIGAQEAEEGRGSTSPFTTSENGLVAQGPKLVGPADEQHFGASVALSGDGNLALVGAPRATANGGTVSSLYRVGASWEVENELISGAGAKNRSMFGAAVALSGDGTVAAVGSPRDGSRAGAAWAFAEAAPPQPVVTNVTPGRGPAAGGTQVTIEGEFLSRPQHVTFGGAQAASVVRTSATEITVVTPPGGEGRVPVSVTTAGGTSAASSRATFFYEAADPSGGGSGGNGNGNGSGNGSSSSKSSAAGGGVAGFTSTGEAVCSVSLRRARLAVTRYRTVALRLTRTGAGACRGKLALSYRVKAKGRGYALRTIGTASFSIAAGTSRVVKVTLTKAGRKWLRSHRGKANASLAIARVVPAPTTARSASVRLSVKKPPKR